eukprot:TRINITY_DN3690_c0_g1_i1.p1 TRINITY_DN3690_c0_g1~~TRINITY_DN3690_c0_g1_i1.p1  ORF type:complete len:384 (-),score=65.21 TRINITY_DN3690_c0_g1_i1:146-1297(-)
MNLILYYGGELTTLMIAYYPIILYLILETPVITVDLNQLGIPEQILPVYLSMVDQIHPLAEDQLPGMQSLLQNYLYLLKGNIFIYKEPLFQKTFYQLLEEVITKIMNLGFQNSYENDMIYALKLIIGVIENNVDANIQPLIERIVINCLAYLNKGRKSVFEVAVYEVISVALWANPQQVLSYLVQTNTLPQFFKKWNDLSKHFNEIYTKSYMMYGLASILRVNPEEMKSEVVAVLRDVLKWIVKLAGEIVEKREDLEFESESEEDDGEERLLDAIKLDGGVGSKGNKGLVNEDEDDDDDDEDFNGMAYHPFKFRSILLDNDELKYLEDIFSGLMKNQQAFYANISNCLTENEKAQLLENFQKSKEWFCKKQAEQEEKLSLIHI